MATSRAGFRLYHSLRPKRFLFPRPIGRRFQSVDAAQSQPTQSTLQRLWNSPVGMKTVHFWFDPNISSLSFINHANEYRAPVMKVGSLEAVCSSLTHRCSAVGSGVSRDQ